MDRNDLLYTSRATCYFDTKEEYEQVCKEIVNVLKVHKSTLAQARQVFLDILYTIETDSPITLNL